MKHVVVMMVRPTLLLSCLVRIPWTWERAAVTPNTALSSEEGKNSSDHENFGKIIQ